MSEVGGGELKPVESQRWMRLERRLRRRDLALSGGLTGEEREEFKAREEERAKGGAPSIDELGLPNRSYYSLRRFGVKTVEGVNELLQRGVSTFQVGGKSTEVIRQALTNYQVHGK